MIYFSLPLVGRDTYIKTLQPCVTCGLQNIISSRSRSEKLLAFFFSAIGKLMTLLRKVNAKQGQCHF